ncbi:MAG: hypothetical protein KatS3mg085_282 [Candidatus Dojkabacteria bacterium]|nr:MAG: hypothetical protein KatS3mg085_282 [Candidatus Dojkabacteria bacterium]GIW58900.1 MAG: hypothetical protein KatS3mg086_185 [Candidatus Dojkabacteria bacterium]
MNTTNLQLIDFLNNLDLDEEESKICFVLIQEGPQTMLNLSKRSGINRTTTYRICEKLKNQGIVEIYKENKAIKAKIASFENLKQLVSNKLYKAKTLQTLLPDIKVYMSQSNQSIDFCKTYPVNNFSKLIAQKLIKNKEILVFLAQTWEEILGVDQTVVFFESIVQTKSVIKEIYTPKLLTKLAINSEIKKFYLEFRGNFQTKMVNTEDFNLTQTILLCGGETLILSKENTIELSLESITYLEKKFFENLWENN